MQTRKYSAEKAAFDVDLLLGANLYALRAQSF